MPPGEAAGPESRGSQRRRRAALAALVLTILTITLWPLDASNLPEASDCVFCGARGLADALLNMVMFAPLGLLLARGRRPAVVVALAILFSAAIELAQMAVPGRYPSPADVLFNSLGAAVGVLLHRASRLAAMPATALHDLAGAGAAVLVAGVLFITGWLLEPDMPSGPYHIAWEPVRAGEIQYPGTVTGAAVGPFQAREGPVANADRMSAMLAQGGPVGVGATWAGAVPGRAPLLGVFDASGQSILMIAMEGEDVVFSERLRATRWRMVTPSMRMPVGGAVTEGALQDGDTLRLATFRLAGGRCFDVQDVRTCGLGLTAGSGWSLLHGVRASTETARLAFNGVWLALLLLPVGFLARPALAAGLLAALVWYAVVRLPFDTILLPATWPDMAGMGIGVMAGAAARLHVRGRAVTGGAEVG